MRFILIKDLINIFIINWEWFIRILIIIIMIEFSRLLKCSLILSRILKNSSWMNFRSIIFAMIEILEYEDINKICEMIEMIAWWIIKKVE